MTKKKPFYGWFVVLLLFILGAVPMVWVSSFIGYYQMPICEELGCSYVQFNLCSTGSTIAGIIFGATLAGKVSEGKTRFWMMGGGIIAGVCMFLMGLCTSIWPMILLFTVANFAFCATTYIPINVLISCWFVDKRATATSWAMMGGGFGGIVFTPVVSSIIAVSWRRGFFVTAAIVLASALIIPWFLKKPEEMGCEPLMPKNADAAESADQAAGGWEGLTKKEALKTTAFYSYAWFCICTGIISAGAALQLPTFFTESGLDYVILMSIFSAALLVAMPIMGRVIEKFGLRTGGILMGGLVALSMVLFVLVPKVGAIAFLAVVVLPLGDSISGLGPPLIAGEVFGMKDYGAIYGLGYTCFTVGCLIGPLLASALRTMTGSYTLAWIVFAIIVVTEIISLCITIASKKNLQKVA